MDAPKLGAERQTSAVTSVAESAPVAVFQPRQLKEIVDVIDLMGNIASRVREDSSGDLPQASGAGAKAAAQTGTVTARDQAIAAIPPVPIMQQKLISHLQKEVRSLERQARKLAWSRQRGSAHVLSELYKKIRRLSSFIADIIRASAEVIRRFYISVFIDGQPLVVTGGTLVQGDE
jgi:hypothetical protein